MSLLQHCVLCYTPCSRQASEGAPRRAAPRVLLREVSCTSAQTGRQVGRQAGKSIVVLCCSPDRGVKRRAACAIPLRHTRVGAAACNLRVHAVTPLVRFGDKIWVGSIRELAPEPETSYSIVRRNRDCICVLLHTQSHTRVHTTIHIQYY